MYGIVNQASGGQLANMCATVPVMLIGLAVLTFGVDVGAGMEAVQPSLRRRSYSEALGPAPGGVKVAPSPP